MLLFFADGGFVIVVFLVIIGIVVLGIFAYIADKKEKEARRAWVQARGYRMNENPDYQLPARLAFFDDLRRGDERYANPVIWGEIRSLRFMLFDHHYETYTHSKNGRQTHHHWQTCCVIETGINFPHELKLRPEGFFDKMASVVGFKDINFESHEFSKSFHVSSTDRKFAFDVIHARMMEYLLQHKTISIEIERHAIMLCIGNRKVDHSQYDYYINTTREILDLVPDYLIDQHKVG